MKKRNLLLIFALVMSLCLTSCGEKKEPETVEEAIEQTKSAVETLTEKADKRGEKREELIEKNKVELKDDVVFSVSYADVKLTAYSVIPWTSFGEEEQQLYLFFQYTNKLTKDRSFQTSADIVGYQNGIKLDRAVYMHDGQSAMIQSGVTIDVVDALVLKSAESDVQLKLTCPGEESTEYTLKLK